MTWIIVGKPGASTIIDTSIISDVSCVCNKVVVTTTLDYDYEVTFDTQEEAFRELHAVYAQMKESSTK